MPPSARPPARLAAKSPRYHPPHGKKGGGSATSVAPEMRDYIPPGASILTIQNHLHLLPADISWSNCPHYMYDYVYPAPQFRVTEGGNDEAYVSEGEDSTLLETPVAVEGNTMDGEEIKPVDVPGYVQRWHVDVPSASLPDLFSYGEQDTCEVTVRPVKWNEDLPLQVRELTRPQKPQLGKKRSFEIAAGYHRVLVGFLREIELMWEGCKTHLCLFRATYLLKVLDCFADELHALRRILPGWRSRVLNPILQRQLRGVDDHEPSMVKIEVGSTLGAVAAFYLKEDPLHPSNLDGLLRSLLYLWSVRWSLSNLLLPGTETSHNRFFTIGRHMLQGRARITDEEWGSQVLTHAEATLAKQDSLGGVYNDLLAEYEANKDGAAG